MLREDSGARIRRARVPLKFMSSRHLRTTWPCYWWAHRAHSCSWLRDPLRILNLKLGSGQGDRIPMYAMYYIPHTAYSALYILAGTPSSPK